MSEDWIASPFFRHLLALKFDHLFNTDTVKGRNPDYSEIQTESSLDFRQIFGLLNQTTTIRTLYVLVSPVGLVLAFGN